MERSAAQNATIRKNIAFSAQFCQQNEHFCGEIQIDGEWV
jgi:hypothetical protein